MIGKLAHLIFQQGCHHIAKSIVWGHAHCMTKVDCTTRWATLGCQAAQAGSTVGVTAW